MEARMANNPVCKAKSARTGEPCRKYAISGGTVCPTHGGSAPQTKAAALIKVTEATMPAVAALIAMIESGKHDSVTLGAAKDILDRAGLGATQKVDINVFDTREELMRRAEEILGESADEKETVDE